MYHYGASSPKRHVIFSNSPHVSKLSMGRLLGWKAASNQGRKPCRSYIGKDGKRRFNGTRHLKGTENLISIWGAWDTTGKLVECDIVSFSFGAMTWWTQWCPKDPVKCIMGISYILSIDCCCRETTSTELIPKCSIRSCYYSMLVVGNLHLVGMILGIYLIPWKWGILG